MERDEVVDAIAASPSLISRAGYQPPPRSGQGLIWIEMLSGAGFIIAYHAGLLLLTSHENRYPDRLKTWRIASWISAGAAGVVALLIVLGAQSHGMQNTWSMMVKLVGVASAVITWGYLRQMARRIPSTALTR